MVMLDASAPGWLKRLASDATQYIRNLLDIDLKLAGPFVPAGFPYFLLDQFVFLEGRLLGSPFLFMVQPPDRERTPANIARQWREAARRSDRPIVYMSSAMTAFNRKRLIGQRTPFMVPGNQLFLPNLGVDLRETFRASRAGPPEVYLAPAAQKILIAALLGQGIEGHSASALAPRFRYSVMTMSRALDELERAGLAELRSAGRERHLHLAAKGAQLWQRALPLLRSPVRTARHYRRQDGEYPGRLAGESALARYTHLSDPRIPAVAIAASGWRHAKLRFEPVDEGDEDSIIVETWSYDPEDLGVGPAVDRLSLYLSLREHEDERVQQALGHLLEDIPW